MRFIFSHSALREGWDNPNIFQICTLKESGFKKLGFVVVRGKNPIASGNLGDILVLLKEEENCSAIEEVAFLKIDGSRCYPKIDYTVKGITNDQEEVCA